MTKTHLAVGFVLILTGCGNIPATSGATGATGPAGAQGPQGAVGAVGTSGKISSGIFCSKNDSGSGLTFTLTYQSVTTQSGDRYVTCFLAGTANQISETFFFSSSQVGATTGACILDADIDASSSGFWQFTSQSGVTKAVYTDAGSVHNGYTYTFISGDCSSY